MESPQSRFLLRNYAACHGARGATNPKLAEVDGSHMIMLSHPETVADVILTAAAAVDRQPIAAGR
jgi:hypothetical protein